jgi:hypothetical protein
MSTSTSIKDEVLYQQVRVKASCKHSSCSKHGVDTQSLSHSLTYSLTVLFHVSTPQGRKMIAAANYEAAIDFFSELLQAR